PCQYWAGAACCPADVTALSGHQQVDTMRPPGPLTVGRRPMNKLRFGVGFLLIAGCSAGSGNPSSTGGTGGSGVAGTGGPGGTTGAAGDGGGGHGGATSIGVGGSGGAVGSGGNSAGVGGSAGSVGSGG